MVATVLIRQDDETAVEEPLRPEPLPHGFEPEQRVIFCGISWNRFLAFDRLEIYRRFQVPEVWFWRPNKLEVFGLASAGTYEPLRKSRLLPGLDLALMEHCVAIRSWRQARQAFRAGLAQSHLRKA